MPLPAGQTYRMIDVPYASRPTEPPLDVTLLPRGQGNRRRPRVADDGTLWCIGCDHLMIPASQEMMCRECAKKRKNYLERARRATNAHVAVTIENAHHILEAQAAVELAAFRLMAAERDGYLDKNVIDGLTIACKGLTSAMIRGLKHPLREVLARNSQAERDGAGDN